MEFYFEDNWHDDEVLEAKEEKLVQKLREEILRRDFVQAKQTLRENFRVEARV